MSDYISHYAKKEGWTAEEIAEAREDAKRDRAFKRSPLFKVGVGLLIYWGWKHFFAKPSPAPATTQGVGFNTPKGYVSENVEDRRFDPKGPREEMSDYQVPLSLVKNQPEYERLTLSEEGLAAILSQIKAIYDAAKRKPPVSLAGWQRLLRAGLLVRLSDNDGIALSPTEWIPFHAILDWQILTPGEAQTLRGALRDLLERLARLQKFAETNDIEIPAIERWLEGMATSNLAY